MIPILLVKFQDQRLLNSWEENKVLTEYWHIGHLGSRPLPIEDSYKIDFNWHSGVLGKDSLKRYRFLVQNKPTLILC